MLLIDRRTVKREAKGLSLKKSVMLVSLMFLLLTDALSTLANLILTNPITLIMQQWYQSMNSLLVSNMADLSAGADLNLAPVYTATFSYARQMLFNPKQEILLFLFLLLFLWSLVLSYGFSDWALNTLRDEERPWTALFDRLWMAGKFIVLDILTMALTALGTVFFLFPGLYFLYSLRFARYILLDHPELPVYRAMFRSMQLSRGWKIQLFLLDLSFLGWFLIQQFALNSLFSVGSMVAYPVGILLGEVAYLAFAVILTPYRELSFARYYEAIQSRGGVR